MVAAIVNIYFQGSFNYPTTLAVTKVLSFQFRLRDSWVRRPARLSSNLQRYHKKRDNEGKTKLSVYFYCKKK